MSCDLTTKKYTSIEKFKPVKATVRVGKACTK